MPLRSAISRVPNRWIVCALCSWAFAILSYKTNVFYAIFDVVNFVAEEKINSTGGCPYLFRDSSLEGQDLPLYLPYVYWNHHIAGIAESVFYIGKILMVVPAGILSDLGYSRYVLGGGMFLVAVDYILLPMVSDYGVSVYVVLTLVEGIGEALIYPSIFTLISHLALPSERNFFTALVLAGLYCGDTLGHVLFNLIYVGSRSWSFGHYTTGTVGLVWLAFWSVFTYYTPGESLIVPQNHRSTASNAQQKKSLMIDLLKLKEIPWCKICSSRPFLSLVLIYCSLEWATYSNIWRTLVPYQKYILHLPTEFNNYSDVIVVAVFPTSLIGALFADWVNNHNLTSKTVIKRSFAFIGLFFSSILQVTLPLVGCNIIWFWVLAITTLYVAGLAIPIIYSTPIDLSPRHAGLLMGIMTAASSICFLFDVKIGNILVTDSYNQNQWRNKFLFFSIAGLIPTVLFIFFGSGEKQRWKRTTLLYTQPEEQPTTELETAVEPNLHQPTSASTSRITSSKSTLMPHR